MKWYEYIIKQYINLEEESTKRINKNGGILIYKENV